MYFVLPHLSLISTQEVCKDANTQVSTLRRVVKEKEEAIQRQSTLERKIHELEKQGTLKIQKKGDGDISIMPLVTGGVPSGAEVVTGASMGTGVPKAGHSVPAGASTNVSGISVSSAATPLPPLSSESGEGK